MKSFKLHYVLAAAALTAVASTASAQILKAEIPFSFRTGQTLMAPGAYEVKMPSGGVPYLILRNTDTGKSSMVVFRNPEYWSAQSGDPRLTFTCAASRCALQQVWPGGGAPGYTLPAPKLASGEAAIAREVPLSRVTN